jgi:hypothetical protein
MAIFEISKEMENDIVRLTIARGRRTASIGGKSISKGSKMSGVQ